MSRILCIDDEPAILRLLGVVLSHDGHEAVCGANGRAAMAAIAQGGIEAVLLDLGLPDRDGLELITAIRAVSPVPIIVVSARDDVAEKVTALDLGAADYVTKPFYGDELRARLRVALRLGQGAAPGPVLCHGSIRMVPDRHEVEVRDSRLTATSSK